MVFVVKYFNEIRNGFEQIETNAKNALGNIRKLSLHPQIQFIETSAELIDGMAGIGAEKGTIFTAMSLLQASVIALQDREESIFNVIKPEFITKSGSKFSSQNWKRSYLCLLLQNIGLSKNNPLATTFYIIRILAQGRAGSC